MQENDNKEPKNNQTNKKTLLALLILATIITILFQLIMENATKPEQTVLPYSELLEMMEKDEVEKVTLYNGGAQSYYLVEPRSQSNPIRKNVYKVIYFPDNDFVKHLKKAQSVAKKNKKKLVYETKERDNRYSIASTVAGWVFPMILIYGVLFWGMRMMTKGGGGFMGGIGKSNAKVYVEEKTGVTFSNVAGQDEAKESLREMVDFLHHPDRYLEIGAKLPKGALLVGPPGTGKTLLAKAVAGEAGVPFFSLSGSDFVEMYVGVGASRVRDLFKQAQSMAPCIIFIDEIDAIGKSRDSHHGGGNDEREQTLNQLLSEMDGFDTSKGIIILAATNRPEVLDKALLRPGRFDRRVIVERPDLKGRVETLKVHSKDVKMDETVDLDAIALATSGAVGSDLANMINEAALAAVKDGREYVSQKDLFEAVEVVIAGKEKKDRILNKKEKEIVAYHEVGHALCIAVQKHTEPVQKITIVPRTMGALGYTLQIPEEERYLTSKEEMLNDLVTFFGGRAAEEVKFNSVTTGASNDIERATAIARAMVTQYGMSEKYGLMGLESIQNRYLDGRAVMNCSDMTAAGIDEEVRNMLKEAYDKAVTIMKENMEALDKISEFLISKETITGKEFMKIFREIKGIPEEEYRMLVLDLDGTLTNSEKVITEKTKKALISAQEKGVKVVLASGRPTYGITPLAEQLELEKYGSYILSFNGGTIINCKTKKKEYETVINQEDITNLVDIANRYNVDYLTYNETHILTNNSENEYVKIEERINQVPVLQLDNPNAELNFDIPKMLMVGNGDYMAEVEPKIREELKDKFSVYRSEPFFLEIVPQGIDKAASIERLLQLVDMKKEEVIACGDGFNDLSMIKYAGLGVAMANAQDVVKESADYVTTSNDEDGVAKVVEKFILKEEK